MATRTTQAQAIAALTEQVTALAALVANVATPAPARTAEASAHFKARDIPCSAATPCAKTFKTAKGLDWHVRNIKH